MSQATHCPRCSAKLPEDESWELQRYDDPEGETSSEDIVCFDCFAKSGHPATIVDKGVASYLCLESRGRNIVVRLYKDGSDPVLFVDGNVQRVVPEAQADDLGEVYSQIWGRI